MLVIEIEILSGWRAPFLNKFILDSCSDLDLAGGMALRVCNHNRKGGVAVMVVLRELMVKMTATMPEVSFLSIPLHDRGIRKEIRWTRKRSRMPIVAFRFRSLLSKVI